MPTKNCPHCAEEIQDKAVICKHCKTDLRTTDNSLQSTKTTPASANVDNVIEIKSSLDAKQLMLFQMEFDKQKKSTGYAYLLFFFLGGLGAHAFYLEKRISGMAYIVCLILILAGMGGSSGLEGLSIPLFFLNACRLLIDLVRLGSQVRKMNEQIEKRILVKLVSTHA